LVFAVLRLKGRRASQGEVAEEAPMFERSEFGRRAASPEKRREPSRRSRGGGRQEQTVLVTFAKTKVTRLKAKAFDLPEGESVATRQKTLVPCSPTL
jgi:hypothetical protein